MLPQWLYILMVYGLAGFVALVVGSIAFMTSVLVKSTPASIGIMMAALIGGNFLSYFMADWPAACYLWSIYGFHHTFPGPFNQLPASI